MPLMTQPVAAARSQTNFTAAGKTLAAGAQAKPLSMKKAASPSQRRAEGLHLGMVSARESA